MDSLNTCFFQAPRRIISGENSIEYITEPVAELGVRNVLVLTDKGVWNAGLVHKPLELLRNAGAETLVVDNVPPEPEIQQVQEIYNNIKKEEYHMIVAIGGGSVMDVAKLVSVLMTNDIELDKLVSGIDKIERKGLPSVMIPTTAGTGSEVTQNSILTLPEQELKVGIVSGMLIPDYVILDPMMTTGLPAAITASTGVDAFTHALECYISKKANPFSDMFALRAIHLIYKSIKRAYDDGTHIESRYNMLFGSMLGGLCIVTSGTAAVHALAYPLGGKYKIPHGVSNAILLPHVMEYNLDAIEGRMKNAAVEMGLDIGGLSPGQIGQKVVESLYEMVEYLGIPSTLKDFGVTEADRGYLVKSASKVTRLLDNNPKKMTEDDIGRIYEKLL